MRSVKKIISFFFLVAYLLSATTFRELLKMPALLQHWQHHHSGHHYTGIYNFLIGHYLQENGTDGDAAEDKQLPFKSQDAIAGNAFLSIVPPFYQVLAPLLPKQVIQSFTLKNDQAPANNYAGSIWQPPRPC